MALVGSMPGRRFMRQRGAGGATPVPSCLVPGSARRFAQAQKQGLAVALTRGLGELAGDALARAVAQPAAQQALVVVPRLLGMRLGSQSCRQ